MCANSCKPFNSAANWNFYFVSYRVPSKGLRIMNLSRLGSGSPKNRNEWWIFFTLARLTSEWNATERQNADIVNRALGGPHLRPNWAWKVIWRWSPMIRGWASISSRHHSFMENCVTLVYYLSRAVKGTAKCYHAFCSKFMYQFSLRKVFCLCFSVASLFQNPTMTTQQREQSTCHKNRFLKGWSPHTVQTTFLTCFPSMNLTSLAIENEVWATIVRTQWGCTNFKSDFRLDVLIGKNWCKSKLGEKILMLKPEVSLWDLLEEKEMNIFMFILKQSDVLCWIRTGNKTLVSLILSFTVLTTNKFDPLIWKTRMTTVEGNSFILSKQSVARRIGSTLGAVSKAPWFYRKSNMRSN